MYTTSFNCLRVYVVCMRHFEIRHFCWSLAYILFFRGWIQCLGCCWRWFFPGWYYTLIWSPIFFFIFEPTICEERWKTINMCVVLLWIFVKFQIRNHQFLCFYVFLFFLFYNRSHKVIKQFCAIKYYKYYDVLVCARVVLVIKWLHAVVYDCAFGDILSSNHMIRVPCVCV